MHQWPRCRCPESGLPTRVCPYSYCPIGSVATDQLVLFSRRVRTGSASSGAAIDSLIAKALLGGLITVAMLKGLLRRSIMHNMAAQWSHMAAQWSHMAAQWSHREFLLCLGGRRQRTAAVSSPLLGSAAAVTQLRPGGNRRAAIWLCIASGSRPLRRSTGLSGCWSCCGGARHCRSTLSSRGQRHTRIRNDVYWTSEVPPIETSPRPLSRPG